LVNALESKVHTPKDFVVAEGIKRFVTG